MKQIIGFALSFLLMSAFGLEDKVQTKSFFTFNEQEEWVEIPFKQQAFLEDSSFLGDKTSLEYKATLEEQSVKALFQAFFDYGGSCVPEEVYVLGAEIEEGLLTLNLSNEVLKYGGNYMELNFCKQLLKTALTLPSVKSLTVRIENERQPLPEGRVIEGLTEEFLEHQ